MKLKNFQDFISYKPFQTYVRTLSEINLANICSVSFTQFPPKLGSSSNEKTTSDTKNYFLIIYKQFIMNIFYQIMSLILPI